MRFSVISLLALGVAADLTQVNNVVTKINSQTAELDTAIKGFSGSSSDLLSKSESLISTVKSGTSLISSMPELSLTDAAQVASSVGSLQSAIDEVVSDVIAQKQKIYAAGAGQDTYKTLVAQKAAAEGLATAMTSKVPMALQSTAQMLSSGVATSLQRAITAYEGAPGGSSSSSGSTQADHGSMSMGSSGAAPSASSAAAPKPNVVAGSSGPSGTVTKPSTTSGIVKPALYAGGAAATTFGSSVAALAAIAAAAMAL